MLTALVRGGVLRIESVPAVANRVAVPANAIHYSATVCSVDAEGHPIRFYDGGTFSPYSIESLLELLHDERRAKRIVPTVLLELRGPCSDAMVDEICRSLGAATALGAEVEVRTPRGCSRRLMPAHG